MRAAATAVTLSLLALLTSCSEEVSYQLRLTVPEDAQPLLAEVLIWALEGQGNSCPPLQAGETAPDELVAHAKLTLAYPPAGDPVLPRVPPGAILFAAEGLTAAEQRILRGCAEAEVQRGTTVQVVVELQWICRPDAGGEVLGDGVDNDCDGLTDECEQDADCTDELYCTVGEGCRQGACETLPRDCSDGDDCTEDSCDEAGRRCAHLRVPRPGAEGPPGDATCSNGVDDDCDGLTDGDDGSCNPCSDDLDCDDRNPCTDDVCQGAECANPPVADSTGCDDGQFCTVGEACQGGVCSGGQARDCGDDEPCTEDSCSETEDRCDNAWQARPGAEGPPGHATCSNGVDDDCDGLTDGEDLSCTGCGGDGECDDHNACTADSCGDGVCVNAPVAEGTDCDDGDACTTGEACLGGACGGGAALDADGDRFATLACGGQDCNDGDPAVSPAAVERAGVGTSCSDSTDNDCDGRTDSADPGCSDPSAICSRDGWCWVSPLPQGTSLQAVWGYSADDVWAAGDAGTILHWDGSSWQRVPSWTDQKLLGVWGSSSDDVWAVGEDGTALRWDGVRWSAAPTGTSETITAVHGTSATDVWAAMHGGRVGHWQGDSWTLIDLEREPDLMAVYALAPDDVWTAGVRLTSQEAAILHWDGSTWRTYSDPSNGTICALWGSAPDDMWAFWFGYLAGGAVHWNGETWESSLSSSYIMMSGAWGSAYDDIWAVSLVGYVYHYDGADWGYELPYSGVQLSDVWTDGADGWIVGQYGVQLQQVADSWVAASEQWLSTNLVSAWASGPDDVWAVGSGGMIVHWNGSTWSVVASGTTEDLFDVWGVAPDDIWIVGWGGTALHWDGSSWSDAASQHLNTLQAVWTSPGGRVWGVGAFGQIWSRDNNWSEEESPTSALLHDIWGSGPQDIWAVGVNGTIVHYDGAVWTELPRVNMSTLVEITGLSQSEVWAVGNDGTVVSWDASAGAWVLMATLEASQLLGVWARSSQDIWVVGSAGAVFHWDGASWSREQSGASVNLSAVVGTDFGADLWVFGQQRTVLRKR